MTDATAPAEPSWPERVFGVTAMIGIALIAVLVTTNVVSRWLGRSIVPDDILLVQELMVAVILLPLGLVTAARAHIAVSVFADRLPVLLRRCLTLTGHGVGLVFAGVLLWAGSRDLVHAWTRGGYYEGVLHIPMWLGKLVFVCAMAVFTLRLLAMIVIDARSRPS